ncbi:MAG: glycosyltransferase family 2 protein, partial [Candidatus Bilamarchaeaceae archaeon]
RGKAMAVREALKKINEEYLVMMDSDGSYSIKDISLIIEKLKEADVVIGSRLKGSIERGAMAEINRIGNIFLSFLASLIYGKQISDVCSGMWGFRKKAYKQLDIKAKHFELEVDLFANCAKKNFKIIEVPITYKKRTGKTKLNPFVDGTKIAFHLIKRRFF